MRGSQTAGERFRSGYSRSLRVGFAVSAVLHVAVAVADPAVPLGSVGVVDRPLALVVLAPASAAFDPRPPAVRLPAAEPRILRPARPRPVPESEPGPPETIPFDVAPLLLNVAEVRALIRQRFPPGLEVTESAPSVLLWLFVETDGRVSKLQLRRSSGHAALDALAEDASRVMTFRPALHLGKPVAVWVAQRIRFAPSAPGAPG